MRYRPDIDGLRALAVAPIVLFHAHVPGFDGGYVGVDIFFVISGFLITGILRGELEAGTFRAASFYARRVRRLLPALAAMLVVVTVAALFILLPDDLSSFGASLAATVALSSNILFWMQSGYFDVASDLKPLLHIWSLSIEEQFYLVFPLILVFCARLRLRSDIVVAGLAVVSLAFSAWIVRKDPSTTFFWLHTRAWEFMLGSLIALAPVTPAGPAWLRQALAAIGLALIVGAILTFDRSTVFPGPSALIPCLGAGLIILAGSAGLPTLVSRLLALSPFVGLGRISYSVYLWHWPIAVFWVYLFGRPHGLLVPTALVAGALGAGYLSWRFIETPFRGAGGPSPGRVLAWGAATCAVLLPLGLGLQMAARNPALIERFYGPDIAAIREMVQPRLLEAGCVEAGRQAQERNGCLIGAPGKPPAVALIGDSFADVLHGPLGERLAARGLAGVPYVFYSCPSILGTVRDELDAIMPDWVQRCANFWRDGIAAIAADPAIRVVVMSNNYDWYLTRPSTINGRPVLSPVGVPAEGRIQAAAILDRVRQTVEKLLRAGKTVIFVGTSPSGREDHTARAVMLRLMRGTLTADEPFPADACPDHTAAIGQTLSAEFGDAFVYLDMSRFFLRPAAGGTACFLTKDRRPLTTDGSHLSSAVVDDLMVRIDQAIARALP